MPTFKTDAYLYDMFPSMAIQPESRLDYKTCAQKLEQIISREARFLYSYFHTEVTIRFSSDRLSGSAWLVDSDEDSLFSNNGIGLGAGFYNCKLSSMPMEKQLRLPSWEYLNLRRTPDAIRYTTAINLEKTKHSVDLHNRYILFGIEYRHFYTLEAATEYLQSHVMGLKDSYRIGG